jgi:hypothetical protein
VLRGVRFVEHVQGEIAKKATKAKIRKLEMVFEEKAFHGYLESKRIQMPWSPTNIGELTRLYQYP